MIKYCTQKFLSSESVKANEVITGSASFEAGREYIVQTFNSSDDTGHIIKNEGRTMEFDENMSDGFDENADLSITGVKSKK